MPQRLRRRRLPVAEGQEKKIVRQLLAGEWQELPVRLKPGSLAWKVAILKIDEFHDDSVVLAHTAWRNAGLSPRHRVMRQAELTGCSQI